MQPEPPVQPPLPPNQQSPQQPQAPYGPQPVPTPHPAQYDFIMNPAAPPRKPLVGPSNSLLGRIIVVVGGLFVLTVIAAIFASVLSHGASENKVALIGVAQDQAELAHLADGASTLAVSDNAKNLAINTKLTMTSQQAALTTYLQSRHVKVSTKTLALKQSSAIDTQLTNAQSASNYDPVFFDVMKSQLAIYQRDLQAAYKDARPSAKPLLSKDYDAAALLQKQISQGL